MTVRLAADQKQGNQASRGCHRREAAGSQLLALPSLHNFFLGPAKLYLNLRKNSVIWHITCESLQTFVIKKLLWGLLIFKHRD